MFTLLLLIPITLSFADPTTECDLTKLGIDGGNYTVSDGGNIGSKVQYSCPKGKYPYPSYFQECLFDGHWTHITDQFVCKDVSCPGQLMFEFGEYSPRKGKHSVGDILHFQCYSGFDRLGPETRICQENGQWSGTTTTCQSYSGHCPDPGVPPGASKVGTSYGVNDKVRYSCEDGLHLIGSKERVCLRNGQWSGAEPFCWDQYMHDTPEEVAESFSLSISSVFERVMQDRKGRGDRTFTIRKDPVNIFILLDTSKSIGPKDFTFEKEITEVLIEKISTYDITPRYAVISYATNVKTIVSLSDEDSTDAEKVIERLNAFKYSEHGDKTGTNTRGALAKVLEMLVLDRFRNEDKFLGTQNVIILLTDGKYNMGGNPTVEINRIRELLEINPEGKDREAYLDVYSFGIGNDINMETINNVASKKYKERHTFLMKDLQDLKSAFDAIIDETEAFDTCGLAKENLEGYGSSPWTAKITITRSSGVQSCRGSIITKNFILTAADCFQLDDKQNQITVIIDGARSTVKNIYRHPKYDPYGKRDKNIVRSFDYDVALLELSQKLVFFSNIRPICIPCTESSTRALKIKGKTSCTEHENRLLSGELVKSMIITEEKRSLNLLIKQGSRRNACLEDAKKAKGLADVQDIRDLVTDQFLCTGGIDPVVDPQMCKGDQGGPLIINIRERYFQVGVTSFGLVNSCQGSKRRSPVPANNRDFHISLFSVLPWIQDVVKDELTFI